MKYNKVGNFELPHFAHVEIHEKNGIKTCVLCCGVFANKRTNLPVQFTADFSDLQCINDYKTVNFIEQTFSYLK